MKAYTMIDYAQRIDRVIAFVTQTVGDAEPPAVEALADIAALSPFHFHRIFRLMTGESIGAMMRRVRLARSLAALGDSQSTVMEASGMAGYATSQAFARAIRAVTGSSASEARGTPDALQRVAHQLARAQGAADAPLAIEVVEAAPLRLHVLRNVGAYAELNQGYEQLFAKVFATVPITALVGVHGLFDDDPLSVEANEFRFTCGVELSSNCAPNRAVEDFSGGRCLRARHIGDYESLLTSIDAMTATAICAGLALADTPLRVHYIDTPEDVRPDDLRSDIYLPLGFAA